MGKTMERIIQIKRQNEKRFNVHDYSCYKKSGEINKTKKY